VYPLMGVHSSGRLLALPIIIRLRWKRMEVANTLAYYVIATMTTIESLIVQATGANVIRLFTAVSYDFSL